MSDDHLVTQKELRKELYEQEHRLAQILLNLWNTRDLDPIDPLRIAARRAFIWRVLVAITPAAATAGVSLVALAGLTLTWWQTREMREQNRMLREDGTLGLLQELGDFAAPVPVRQRALDQLNPSRGFDLSACCLNGLDLASYDLSQARMDHCDLGLVKCADVNWEKTSFFRAVAFQADFRRARLRGADFRRAQLHASDFTGADLTGANFQGADMRGGTYGYHNESENYAPACLEGATLTGAVLTNIDLSAVRGLTVEQLRTAEMDDTTILSDALTAAVAGDIGESKGASP